MHFLRVSNKFYKFYSFSTMRLKSGLSLEYIAYTSLCVVVNIFFSTL